MVGSIHLPLLISLTSTNSRLCGDIDAYMHIMYYIVYFGCLLSYAFLHFVRCLQLMHDTWIDIPRILWPPIVWPLRINGANV